MKKECSTENDVKKLVKVALDDALAWSYAPIQTGMGVHGIPDRVCCVPIVVTAEMVGRTVGLFVAVESKRPGRRGECNAGASPAQLNVLREIIEAGGIAMLADGKADVDMLAMALATPQHVGMWSQLLDSRVNKERK